MHTPYLLEKLDYAIYIICNFLSQHCMDIPLNLDKMHSSNSCIYNTWVFYDYL